MDKSPDSGSREQPKSREELEARFEQLMDKMVNESYAEDLRIDDEIMHQFELWEQNQGGGKFDKTELNKLQQQSRAIKQTIQALYAEILDIKKQLK